MFTSTAVCAHAIGLYLPEQAKDLKCLGRSLLGRRVDHRTAATDGAQIRSRFWSYPRALLTRILSRIAKEQASARNDDVVAVLFRDADGTASAGRGLWEDKWQSMLAGFDEEGFDRGVPMIPKPKSEAWLICALKERPYQHCNDLEDRSGNDKSPKSLKKELAKLLGEKVTPELLCDKVRTRVDMNRITMPSFQAFRTRLEAVI